MKSIEECLDIILTHLSKNWDVPGAADRVFMDNQAIMREFDLPGQYLKHEFFKRLIDKLVKDDNAEFIAVNNGFPSHEVRYYEQNIVITVEGFLFLKNEGGYTKKKENEIKERDRSRRFPR